MHDQKTTLNQQSLIDFRFREKEREKKKLAFQPTNDGRIVVHRKREKLPKRGLQKILLGNEEN